jgi:hypothetical protein
MHSNPKDEWNNVKTLAAGKGAARRTYVSDWQVAS